MDSVVVSVVSLSVKFRPNRFLFAGIIPEKVIWAWSQYTPLTR